MVLPDERGIDAEHFNLWDWSAQQSEQPPTVALVKRKRAIPPSAGASVDGATGVASGGSWTAQSVLAACNQLQWPEWVRGFRSEQLEATAKALNLYEQGKKIVILDAPTGTGKTLIGEMVRRLRDVPGLYVCSGLQLQDQFARDFEYGAVLKGRGNYPTERMPYPDYTTGDCIKEPGDALSCAYCSKTTNCPYEIAKRTAIQSELAVLNTTYLLYEANGAHRFSGRKFATVDECDLLEEELMRYVEYRVGEKVLRECGVEPLKKGVHKPTVKAWMEGELIPGLTAGLKAAEMEYTEESRKRAKRLKQLRDKAAVVAGDVEDENWIRDYETSNKPPYEETGAFIMRPVTVGAEGYGALWRHADEWLVMSATVISAEQLAKDVGMPVGSWGLVTVPSGFPVENRPVVVRGVANMTAKTEEAERPKLLEGIKAVLEIHEGENVLVHTHSYKLTKWLEGELRRAGRAVLSYSSSRDRDTILTKFKEQGGVLLAPSLDRGVDLPDELCRVMVVAKSPFPYLGDKQISTRIRLPGGNTWYAVKTVRTIVQMTGRGVRHKEDWAVTYILDSQFSGNVYKKNKGLFPEWWREGVDYGVNSEYAMDLRKRLQ